jgi:glyoxylase-like metal-dependent hydrolase (beta-lactamase superfamily II)
MKHTVFVALAACAGSQSMGTSQSKTGLTVDVHAAKESNVNAFVLSDGAGALVIDATRTAEDGAMVAQMARARTKGPIVVLITHGHPDHFLGLGAMRLALPEARFVVARAEIKADIIGFATWMTGEGWLDQLPSMKPRSASHPMGFDYDRELEVLGEARLALPGGAAVELTSDYAPTEAAHLTTAYSPDLNILFTSDLVYHDVHNWLGVGVSKEAAGAWRQTLAELQQRWRERGPRIYPGHGAPGELGLLETNRTYIADLLAIAASAPSFEAAMLAMIERYPAYENRDFLLKMSVTNQRQLAGAIR